MTGVRKLRFISLDDLSLILVCPTTIVADALDRARDIDVLCPCECFS